MDPDPIATVAPGYELPVVERHFTEFDAEVRSGLRSYEIAERMGVSEARLVEMCNNLDLLGLRTKSQDYIYPAWQTNESGKLIPEVGEILRRFDQIVDQPWEILCQMFEHLAFHEGKSVKDCLVAGDTGLAVEVADKNDSSVTSIVSWGIGGSAGVPSIVHSLSQIDVLVRVTHYGRTELVLSTVDSYQEPIDTGESDDVEDSCPTSLKTQSCLPRTNRTSSRRPLIGF